MTLPESRPLKIAGLTLAGVALAVFGWLTNQTLQAAQSGTAAAHFVAVTVVAVNIAAVGFLLLSAGCGLRTSWRNPRRRHALLLQVLLANVLVPAVAYGVLTSDQKAEAAFDASGWSLPAAAIGIVVALIAQRLWRRAQKYEAPAADEAMALDPRPPVLYLRSFKDDGEASIDEKSRLYRRVFALIGVRTPEQELADILDHVGPVIAIGKPGEPLPELGAARLYVSHDAWQDRVTALMQQAGLIVIRVGHSAGVLWEIERGLALVPRHKLTLFRIGPVAPAPELTTALAPVLGPELQTLTPAAKTATWWGWLIPDLRRPVGSVVCFPAAVPRAVPLTGWPIRGRDITWLFSLGPSALPLRRGWRTVFTLLDLEAGLMADRPSRGVAVLLALAFGCVGAHWFYLGQRQRGFKYLRALIILPMFLSYYDALQFLLADRRTFDATWGTAAPSPR